MGLAQMHQLRAGSGAARNQRLHSDVREPLVGGRPGRQKSFRSTDGSRLPGAIFCCGAREFLGAPERAAAAVFADLPDRDLLEAARDAAPVMLERFPELARKHLARWMGWRQEYLKV